MGLIPSEIEFESEEETRKRLLVVHEHLKRAKELLRPESTITRWRRDSDGAEIDVSKV
jgi:hypothetical protein